MIRNWLRVMMAAGTLALACAPALAQPRQPEGQVCLG
jgi:hypothetical protein